MKNQMVTEVYIFPDPLYTSLLPTFPSLTSSYLVIILISKQVVLLFTTN